VRRATIGRTEAPPVEWRVRDCPPDRQAIPLGQACGSCHMRYEHADQCPNHWDLHADTYPHNHLKRLGYPPLDRWQCQLCGDVGTMAEVRAKDCTFDYEPCTTCGYTPECSPDCGGIAAALTLPGVHLAGFGPEQ